MEVRSFKLISGQELVAEVLGETGRGYKVKNPLAVHVMQGPDGQGHLAFAQWSMVQVQGEVIELFSHALAAEPVKLVPEVEHSYAEQVTGLSLPAPPSSRILRG